MISEAQIEKVECDELTHNRHSVGESNYHLQFTPNFRREIFIHEKVRNLCKYALMEKAKSLGIILYCVNFGPDHCHFFVGNCKNYSVADLVRHFKGFSSYLIRMSLWNTISKYLWGKRLWSEGYFYESVGRVTSASAKFYIERQQGKHWTEEELRSFEMPKEVDPQSHISDFF